MANPPITIGPFDNVPTVGSPIRSDWPQEISTLITSHKLIVDGWAVGGIAADLAGVASGGTTPPWTWTINDAAAYASAGGNIRILQPGYYVVLATLTFTGTAAWVQSFTEHFRGGSLIISRNALASAAGGFASAVSAFLYLANGNDEIQVRVAAASSATLTNKSQVIVVRIG